MKLYHIYPKENSVIESKYYRYLGAIVVANDELEARTIHPCGTLRWIDDKYSPYKNADLSWVNFENVECKFVGEASSEYTKPQVILNSTQTE